MNEWNKLVKITSYLNDGDYRSLEEFVIQEKDNISTRFLIDALTELPLNQELIIKHRNLYESVLKYAEPIKPELGMKGAIRLEMIKIQLNELR